ncbi:MAG: hypothetical protein Q4B43_10395 [Bacteroidota bacterium]|nr:hypothetical protein [Bacteroidota bacterium]
MKRLLKKLAAITITGCMIASAIPTYAENNSQITINGKEYTVQVVSDNIISVKSEGVSELLTVKEDDNYKTVTMLDLNSGKEEYLRLDKSTNKLYSSITNKTIDMKTNGKIIPVKEVSYSTEYISFATIKDTIGTTATAAGVIGLLLTWIPSGITQVVGGVIGTVSTIVGGGTLLIPDDPNHGIKFVIRTERYYRMRLGRRNMYKKLVFVESASRY